MARKKAEIFILLLVTLFLYWPSFDFDFVNFDDQVYVTNNSFVQNPSFQTLVDGSETGNFHPLTMLTLRFDQWIGNGSPSTFHISNVLWHVLNSVLVYVILSRFFPSKQGLAFFVALMFAIHPMHVESVAWVSSRKDVVYTFFFLLSILFYWDYLDSKKKWQLLVAFFAGVLSFLGKPSSIVLPLVLVLLQYVKKQEIVWKELIPLSLLLIGSFAIGLATLNLQSGKSINDFETYSLIERVMFAVYGVGFYVFRSIFPFGLSPMHAYPSLENLASIDFVGFSLLGVLFLLGLLVFGRKYKWILLGGGMFLLGLILTLQFVSIGRAIVSERYTYMAYVGLFLLFAFAFDKISVFKPFRYKFYIISAMFGFPFLFLSVQYVHCWKNSETLWSKAITENSTDWYGFIGRGNYYEEHRMYENALDDFKTAVSLASHKDEVYYNLGDLQFKLGHTQDAISTYSSAILLNPTNSNSYVNRGQFYVAANSGDLALADFNYAILLDSSNVQAHINRGNLFLLSGNFNKAVADFSRAVVLDSSSANAWYNLGTAEMSRELFKAEKSLLKAIDLNPDYFDAYNNLGSVYYQIGDLEKAETSFLNALTLKPSAANIWLNLSVIQNNKGDYAKALESAVQAKNRGGQVNDSYLIDLKNKLQ